MSDDDAVVIVVVVVVSSGFTKIAGRMQLSQVHVGAPRKLIFGIDGHIQNTPPDPEAGADMRNHGLNIKMPTLKTKRN